jgi:hypothetical protein
VEAGELGRTEADDSFWSGFKNNFQLPDDTNSDQDSDESMASVDEDEEEHSDDRDEDAMLL